MLCIILQMVWRLAPPSKIHRNESFLSLWRHFSILIKFFVIFGVIRLLPSVKMKRWLTLEFRSVPFQNYDAFCRFMTQNIEHRYWYGHSGFLSRAASRNGWFCCFAQLWNGCEASNVLELSLGKSRISAELALLAGNDIIKKIDKLTCRRPRGASVDIIYRGNSK